MIESPLLEELFADITAETQRNAILEFLTARFTTVTPEIKSSLAKVTDSARLKELIHWAANCPDLNTFRTKL
jgi:hypothetical protein